MPLLFDEAEHGAAAQMMVQRQLAARGIGDARVLDAMRTVPRHAFVAPHLLTRAYDDEALPTRNGQTISQPYIVALMCEQLAVKPGQNILEIGTGSGYQTAILSQLVDDRRNVGHVVSIERDAELADAAREALARFNITNVTVHVADGTLGYPPSAPYDRITVTAGAPPAPAPGGIPPPLLEQLANPGRLVIPLGSATVQHLHTLTKHGDQLLHDKGIACRFVPLTGEHGW